MVNSAILVGLCRIWSDLVGLGPIRSDSVAFNRIQSDSIGFNRIQSDSVRFGRIRSDSVGFGLLTLDSVGFGLLTLDLVNFLFKPYFRPSQRCACEDRTCCVSWRLQYLLGLRCFGWFQFLCLPFLLQGSYYCIPPTPPECI